MIASPVLILGARSDIGRALARAYAAQGAEIIIAARGDMEAERRDLEIRAGAKVHAISCDITDGDPDGFFARLDGPPGTVIMVVGLLGDQLRSAADDTEAARVMATNYEGPARYLLSAARTMDGIRDACIIGISSVAGDRGRGSNFIYGSAKAGLTAFLSGLRNAHAKRGCM
jgi:decaprenylphospho-beta-D-erythro-pentofuranosid-2-ulose 2-reductase